jgi:hypothetical protein
MTKNTQLKDGAVRSKGQIIISSFVIRHLSSSVPDAERP